VAEGAPSAGRKKLRRDALAPLSEALDAAWGAYRNEDRHWRRTAPASELSERELSEAESSDDEVITMPVAHAAARAAAGASLTKFAEGKRGAAAVARPAGEEGEALDADAPLLPPGWQPPRGMRQVPASLPLPSGQPGRVLQWPDPAVAIKPQLRISLCPCRV